MRGKAILLAGLLFSSAARADGIVNGGSGSSSGSVAGAGAPTGYLNVMSSTYGAKGDTLSYNDGTITAGTDAFSSASATFTAADVGKQIVVDYAGAAGAPLVTTITGFTGAHNVTLAANASTSVPYFFAAASSIVAAGTGCAPNDTVNYSGGTSTTTAIATITHCLVASFAQNANGSGGKADNGTTAGTCTVTGTTGSGGVPFSVAVTLTAGAISAIGATKFSGQYSTNPTSIAAEPVTGCNGLTGATLALTMGVRNLRPSTTGVYSVKPSNPISQGSASGSETNITFNGFWVTAGGFFYGTDDTAAFTSAINAEIASWKAGKGQCVFVPAGSYFISSTLPTFYSTGGIPGCVEGDTRRASVIRVSPSLSGDVFSVSRSFNFSQDPLNGPSENGATWEGTHFSNLIIIGDRTTSNQQNGIMFYDENQNIVVDNVEIDYLNGAGIGSGTTKNSTNAYLAESWFTRIRMNSVGNATSPNIDINEAGSGQGPNELRFNDVDLYANYGIGLWIHSRGTINTGAMSFVKLRIEGLQWDSATVGKDLIQIGDAAGTSAVTQITFMASELIDPYIGAAAIHLTAAAVGTEPFGINWNGNIAGGAPLGKGILIDFGRTSSFSVTTTINSWDYNVAIGASTNVSSDIDIFSQAGDEFTWTYSLGSGSNQTPTGRILRKGIGANGAVLATPHDTSATGGNAAGAGAVDLQLTRLANTQVASGQNSAILGGQLNIASGFASVIAGGEVNNAAATDCTISGGNTNTCSGNQGTIGGGFINSTSGINSWIPGGKAANDRSRFGIGCAASGVLAAFNGDAQHCIGILRCTVATSGGTCVMTADQAAAGAANCVNIPNNTIYTVDIALSALDHTTPANNWSWTLQNGLLTRGANAASTTFSAGSNVTLSNGTVTAIAATPTADTTNGCLTLTFTHPTGTTNTWNAVARVHTVEVQ